MSDGRKDLSHMEKTDGRGPVGRLRNTSCGTEPLRGSIHRGVSEKGVCHPEPSLINGGGPLLGGQTLMINGHPCPRTELTRPALLALPVQILEFVLENSLDPRCEGASRLVPSVTCDQGGPPRPSRFSSSPSTELGDTPGCSVSARIEKKLTPRGNPPWGRE